MSHLTPQTTVEVVDFQDAEPAMLEHVMQKVRWHGDGISKARILIDARKPDGWLEYLLILSYRSGGGITIGCIQRKKGEVMEFHS